MKTKFEPQRHGATEKAETGKVKAWSPGRCFYRPTQTLNANNWTQAEDRTGRITYRCACASCARRPMRKVKDGVYVCRDCGQHWRVNV